MPFSRSLTLYSPAKINIFLKIVDKRPDGYHNLSSLFQAIDLCDILHISLSSQDRDTLTCNDPSIPSDSTNLVLKAVELFRRKTGLMFFVKIDLEKYIPSQAGLGGGSSNAATTLWALNELLDQRISLEQMAEWSEEIGSDIPFFFSQGTALCTRKGENVKNICLNKNCQPLWIVKPSLGLSTPLVYKSLNLSNLPFYDLERYLHCCIRGEWSCFNDLEIPAFTLMPSLARLKNKLLLAGFHTVLMSGSGSAFFCLGEGKLPDDEELYMKQVKVLNRERNIWYTP